MAPVQYTYSVTYVYSPKSFVNVSFVFLLELEDCRYLIQRMKSLFSLLCLDV